MNDKMKHTPGPWTAKNTPGAGLSVHADVSKALGERYSKDCPVYHVGSDNCSLSITYELWTQFPRAEWAAMQEANARLIAAAPELLAACQALVRYQKLIDSSKTHGLIEAYAESFEAAAGAVAKATGEQA